MLVFLAKDYQTMVSVAVEEVVGPKVDSLLEGTAETFFLPWVWGMWVFLVVLVSGL